MASLVLNRERFLALVAAIATPACASLLGGDFENVDEANDVTDSGIQATDTGIQTTDTGGVSGDTGAPPADTGCSLGGHAICNPRTNCGCATGKCDWTNGVYKTACFGPTCEGIGTHGTGAPCLFTYECDEQTTCFWFVCQKKTCVVDTDCSPAGDMRCVTIPGCAADPDAGWPSASESASVCANLCILSDPGSCGFTSGNGCVAIAIGTGAERSTTCTKMADTNPSSCSFSWECAPGYYCADLGDNKCHHWCRLGHVPDDCPTGSCTAMASGPYIANGVSYGFCL